MTRHILLFAALIAVGVPAIPASAQSDAIAKESIERLPALDRGSLPDVDRHIGAGMIRGHDDFVHVRGEEIALNPIIDGVAFWENPHAMFSAGVSPDIIETANVMTGAFPAEYGNRFGGVVDVATKSGLRLRERGTATFSFGGNGRRHAAADVGGRRGSLGYFFSGAALASNRFLSPPDPEAIHDAGDAQHAFGHFDWSGARFGAMNVVIMGDAADAQIPKMPQMRRCGRPRTRTRPHASRRSLLAGRAQAPVLAKD